MAKELVVTGFGDVWEKHFECGLDLAKEYFSRNRLDYLECYEAYVKDESSTLGQHWVEAERFTNLALYAFNLYESATLLLEIEED